MSTWHVSDNTNLFDIQLICQSCKFFHSANSDVIRLGRHPDNDHNYGPNPNPKSSYNPTKQNHEISTTRQWWIFLYDQLLHSKCSTTQCIPETSIWCPICLERIKCKCFEKSQRLGVVLDENLPLTY